MLRIVDISGDGNQPANPDMQAAARAGVAGAMIKLGGGQSYANPDHPTQALACNQAGVPSGDYHFMREDGHAGTWRVEADHFLFVRSTAGRDVPFALDWERDGWTRADVLNWLDYTSGHLQRASGIYLNQDFAYRYDVAHEPAFARYWLWLADWTPPADLLAPWREIGLWQFTSQSNVAGIGPVDENMFSGTADDFRNLGSFADAAGLLDPVVTERYDWGGVGRIVAEEVTVQNPATGVYYSSKKENGRQYPWRIV